MTETGLPDDNLAAAVDQVIANDDLSISPAIEGATTQILFRCTPAQKERWVAAARMHGKSLSEFLRDTVEAEVAKTEGCKHIHRKVYPWASFCRDCGKRLSG